MSSLLCYCKLDSLTQHSQATCDPLRAALAYSEQVASPPSESMLDLLVSVVFPATLSPPSPPPPQRPADLQSHLASLR